MPNEFQYDVFLSHSAKDKAVVRPLAERLRQDGLLTDSPSSTLTPQPLGGSDWAQLRLTPSQQSTLNPQPTGALLNHECGFTRAGFDIPIWHFKPNPT